MASESNASKFNTEIDEAQGTVIGDNPQVTQYFGSQPGAKPSVSYWVGRPASIERGYVGREVELDALASAFANHRGVVLSGGAGCGKSRLAAEYTYNSGDHGFWTAAGGSVTQTLVALAQSLDVSLEGRSEDEIAVEVQVRLASLPADILWAIDNLGDLDLVNALLGVAGPVRLLITTRDQRRHVLPNTVAFQRLGVLGPDPAVELLCSRSNCDPNDPALPNIVEIVGRLPLALEMLAVRLGEPRQDPGRLLAELRRAPTPIELGTFLKQVEGATISKAEAVFATIAGTLADLPEDVREQLSALCYIADVPVPDAFLAAIIGLGDEGLDRLIAECSRRSVLSPSDGQVMVHALTVATIAATNAEGALSTALALAGGRLASINQDDPVALRAEIGHYEQVYSHARRTLGVNDISVLDFSMSLAIAFRDIGRYGEAIGLHEETLKSRERALGPDHLDTLGSRNSLAGDYWAAGRYEDTIGLAEETLAVRERVLGPDHPDTLGSRSNLAVAYRAVGRNEEAIRLDEETLKVQERALGPGHPDTLSSRNNLAVGYRAVGRNEEAIGLDEETLKVLEHALGPDHPDTLGSRSNLAVGYRAVGRNEEAIRLDEETLKIREHALGPDHPDTLSSRNNLAVGYRVVGRNEEAIRLDEETLKIFARVLGPDHPDTLSSRSNLAVGYDAAGRYDEAIRLDEETLKARERVLGPDHFDTIQSRNNLAESYRAAGRDGDAEELDSKK